METKICNQCLQSLPLEAFHKATGRSGGVAGKCRKCASEYRRLHPDTEEQRIRKLAHSRAKYAENREAVIARTKEYHRVNKERHQANGRKWRENNAELMAEYAAKYRKSDKFKQYTKRYRLENPEKIRRKQEIRRYRMKNGDKQTITREAIAALWHKQKGRCLACRAKLGTAPTQTAKFEIDHIHPLAKGGTNEASNLQLLCRSCNRRKSAKLPHVFAQELGRLFI